MADTLDPTTLGDLLRVASAPDFDRWQDQIRRTGGCSDPIHLTGWYPHPRQDHRPGPAPPTPPRTSPADGSASPAATAAPPAARPAPGPTPATPTT